jgi:hypothetical protein
VLIPQLDTEINELLEKTIDPKFLDGEKMDDIFGIITELD